jgi:capsular exopolysaccharide synthesis family protein
MELRQYLSVVRKWWWLILLSVVVAASASYLATKTVAKTYLSRATLIVGQALLNPNPSASEFSVGSALAQSYADLARRQPVLNGALETLGLPWDWSALQNMVTSRIVPGTQLLEISVLDTDPVRAQALAKEIVQQLILLSPAGDANIDQANERQFIGQQIADLRTNIQLVQGQLTRLDSQIATTTDAQQLRDLRSQQTALRSQFTTWQATYAQLLSNLNRSTTNYLSIVETPQVPTREAGPRPLENTLLAALIGLILSLSGAFILEYMDDTIKTPEDARQVFNLAVLGMIGQIEGSEYPDKLVTVRQPRSPIAESFRILRTNLQFSAVDRSLNTLMITSISPSEGKSVVSANLAVVMAQSGKRVILVDGDLRRPTQHRIFELKNSRGLTNVLLDGPAHLAEVLQATSVENLQVLTAGVIPPNPSEMIGSVRMQECLQALQSYGDFVIIDTPPVMVVSDATMLSPRVDGVLLIVNSGRTRRPMAQRAETALKTVGARILGLSLNRLAMRDAGYYYDYYYAHDEDQPRRRWFSRNGHSAKAMPNTPAEKTVSATDKV